MQSNGFRGNSFQVVRGGPRTNPAPREETGAGSLLPFTGAALIPMVVLAGALIWSGLVLKRKR